MQSMDKVYQQYAQMVYRFLLSKTCNPDIAEELTQETFYQAIRTIDRFDGSCQLSTWLCAIAKNVYHTWKRKHPEYGSMEEYTKTCDSAEENAMQAMERVDLMKKLHSCPEPLREILYMRLFGDLSFKEIGEIMGRTENWARVNFYRGKEKLRKEWGKDEV